AGRLQYLPTLNRLSGGANGGLHIQRSSVAWPELPVPHPLDFTWWFERDSADRIAGLASDLTRPADRVVFLGTPTVYLSCCSRRLDRKLVLLDADPAVLSKFESSIHDRQMILCDLLEDELPALRAQLVIADPPWNTADREWTTRTSK